ncbi:hypothetical protein OQA88_10072 [Cercophora sp. LCS_1]
MPVEGATQGLIAAFTFGIVVNAAAAALFLYTKGHGSAIFRDSQRLVLVLFLFSAALWAQIDFITVLLDVTRSSMSCQVGIIFATVFDQLARFSIEQYLVWAMNNGSKPTVYQMIPQFIVLGRFVAGAVFTGFTRPQTDTFCVATSSTFPVAVVVIVLDVVILLALTIKAFSKVPELDPRDKDADLARRVSVKLILLGVAIWTASSVTLLLGIRTVELVARTAVPAAGLTILIIIVTGCAGTLSSTRGSTSRPPEAPSPRRLNISRDISTADSDYPPSRYEDLKEAAIRSSTTFVNPREAPRFKDETGVGFPFSMGLTVQEEQMPSLPANAAALSGRARKIERTGSLKGGVFGFGKPAPTITVAKAMIGNPILQENDGQNPLNKIATVDLQEAARAEKERRARMQAEPAKPPRPVTQMSMSPEEVLKRAVSVKRKEVQSVASQPGMPISLQPEAVGTTTAAQLSPGVDEIRRRSPRQPSLDQIPSLPQPQPPSPVEPLEAVEPIKPAQPDPPSPPRTVRPQPAFPTQPIARPSIRPSRQAPPSPKTPPPEPEKNALQRRPTIGLPTNPRARAMKIAQEAGAQQQQTVMFVNNIVYNDPTVVQDVLKGANDMAKNNSAVDDASVVNRPRPIPRKPDSVVPPSPSPKHRRNKSGGSIGRKSILTSAPGSPTQLPPLPPPPVPGNGVSIRPQPNDTKSMTVDEKMTLFFPSPPSAKGTKKGDAVPELPPIPVSYLDTNSSPTESRRSNRTTKTSFKTESILDVDEIPRKQPMPASRFSPLTEMNLADDVDNSWLPGISDNRSTVSSRRQPSGPIAKRASSPVLPPVMPIRNSAWTETTDARTEDDAITNWGTVHSPEIAVGVQVMQRGLKPATVEPRVPPVPKPTPASNLGDITFRLDELDFGSRGNSWLMDDAKAEPARSTPSPSQWHRRVGDECPSFSAREKEKQRARKVPAPTPLMLNGRPTKNMVVIQAEPSPLESPEHALQEIQAQLKKLEDSTRDSMNSTSRRLALLENLEKEMGQQEDHWQEMKHDLGRDSMTSMQTVSPNRNSHIEPAPMISREPSRSSIALERRASRRAKMRSGAPKGAEGLNISPSTQRTTSVWQKRLTEAQNAYMEVAADLLRAPNNNYVSVSKVQLGSPTPPDSDASDEEMPPAVSSRLNAMIQPLRAARTASLWKPAAKESSPKSLLWAPAKKAAPEAEPELPGLFVRPAPRKEWTPLEIHSTHLWRKPYVDENRGNGLWRPLWASAAPPANLNRMSSQGIPQSQSQNDQKARPLTQRPPRRNKRMTLLPDILESPEPLPDKRGTLGIFQFPWGERSDTASVIAARPAMYMAMPGTMSSGSLTTAQEERARQLEQTEYSSSFFDDYDDDDEDNSEGGEESDDGFDETTLWEIASLLKTDNIPSKNSLLPPPMSNSVVEEYMDDIPSDDDSRSREQSIVIGLEEPRVLFDQPRQVSELTRPKGKSQAIVTDESSATWTLEEDAKKSPPAPAPKVFGLPANPKASKIPRAVSPPAPAPTAAPVPVPKPSQIPRFTGEVKKAFKSASSLWVPPSASDNSTSAGLFTLNTTRTIFRTTTLAPAAQLITRKPRPVEFTPLPPLASASLWTRSTSHKSSQANSLHRRATAADWDAALIDALAASYTRRHATESEWTAALNNAIRASARFDAATRHPVFAAPSLITLSEWFHPAATGYTYDVANVHPVFFGSLAITCAKEEVHPAMSAWAAKKLRRARSKVSTRERPSERAAASRRLSRSDSVKKDEPKVQAQTFEQGGMDEMMMARIAEMEQERLFVQQAAEEEYRRRLEGDVLMSAAEVVAQQQRRLSRANSLKKTKEVKVKKEKKELVPMQGLWKAPAKKSEETAKGLWSVERTGSSDGVVEEEDKEAHERRAKGRKAIQKASRRAEILAQIAMIEADIDPMGEFRTQQMWSLRAARRRGDKKRNWLHERKPSRVALRY